MNFKLLKFNNEPCATKESLMEIADSHFHSVDTQSGEEIFSINRNLARWLLHRCQHETPSQEDIRRIAILTFEYNSLGAKKSWPKSPIVIDTDACIIRDGVLRLYAIAHTIRGVCMPVRFIGERR